MDIPGFDPADFPTFLHARAFERQWSVLGLTDIDLAALEGVIRAAPTGPAVIPGAGMFRKLRFAPPSWDGAGKRGASRVIYAYYPAAGVVVLGAIYTKGKTDNLPAGQRDEMAAISAYFDRVFRRARGKP